MKEFKVRSGNFLKSSNSTSNMMYAILVVLIPFIIFSTYKNGIYPIIKGYGNLYLVFKPLIFASVASLFCIVTEYLYYYIKKDKRSFYKLFSESYAIIPGIFLSLIIPINTPNTIPYILLIPSASGIKSKHIIDIINPDANDNIKLKNLLEFFLIIIPSIPPIVVPNVPKNKPSNVVFKISFTAISPFLQYY